MTRPQVRDTPRSPTPYTIPRAFNALHLLPPNVMATTAVKVNRTSVTSYFNRPYLGSR